jgi:hypothetical protein
MVEANPGGYISVLMAVVVQADGGVVAAGAYGPTSSDVAVVRWESDGDLDLTFDGDGPHRPDRLRCRRDRAAPSRSNGTARS